MFCSARMNRPTAKVRLLLALLILGTPFPALGAVQRQVTSYGIGLEFQVESAIGEVPGHWGLTSKGFRDQFLPDDGFGKGVFSVPMDAPAALAFDLDSISCVPCALVKGRAHQSDNDSRLRNAYKCEPGLQGRQAFFMASAESVFGAEDPGWAESKRRTPRFKMTGTSVRAPFFHEWISSKEIAPGERLACGAWIEGVYPPKGEYSEEYGDTIAAGTYVIRDRAIYLVVAGSDIQYLFRSEQPIESGKSTFELAFLPPRYSDLENVDFSHLYRVRGGFWLRVNFSRSFEGAGADEGMFILDLRKDRPQLLAGDTAIRMY